MRYQMITEQEMVTLCALIARGSSTPGVRADVAAFEQKRLHRVILEVIGKYTSHTLKNVETIIGVYDDSALTEEMSLRIREALAELVCTGDVIYNENTGLYRRAGAEGDAPAAKMVEAARR